MNQEQEKIYNELVSKYNFNTLQRFEIRVGLQNNINVDWYAKPEFNYLQMRQIRLGLEAGVNVNVYARPEFKYNKMEKLKDILLENKNSKSSSIWD